MDPLVNLSEECSLQGKIVYARNSTKPISIFLGIPYAKPPIGALRFKPPAPATLWSGKKSAKEFGPICPQSKEHSTRDHFPFPYPENVNEDCLYLNVYTPNTNPNAALPVMVWIHGGGFYMGYSNFYEGTALCTFHDVVYVSINYRLGPFGFMYLDEHSVSGNMGLLDQVEALRWVKKHIVSFGGNPDNVTVFGVSAGGISIAHHLASPETKGLFRRAICQSGTSLFSGSLWTRAQARKYALNRLQKMGCKETDGAKILAFLEGLSSDEIVEGFGLGFSCVLCNTYVTEQPEKALLKPCYPVDLLLGCSTHEGGGYTFEIAKGTTVTSRDHAKEVVSEIVQKRFFRGLPGALQVQARAEELYLENCKTNDELIQQLVQMYGDVLFVAPTVDLANIWSSVHCCPTFLYIYAHRLSVLPFPDWIKADHAFEVPLVLGEPYLERFPDVWSDSDKKVSKQCMQYWTNFAKTGSPIGVGNDNLVLWPPYNKEEKKYLVIQENPIVAQNHKPKEMSFWNTEAKYLSQNQQQSKY